MAGPFVGARAWSVETADLTPRQRTTHADVAAAMMRWRLQHQPTVALQDATKAQLEDEAAHQYEQARRAIERTKWLRAIAAELPDEDAVVKDHVTPARVLELRSAVTVHAKPLLRRTA